MKIVQATGQTCNQFWIYSNFLADAIEKKEKFAIWVPDKNFEDFPNLLFSNYIKYPLYSAKIHKIFGFFRYTKLLNLIFNKKVTLSLFKFLIENTTGHKFIIADVTIQKSKFKFKHFDNLIISFNPSQLIVENVKMYIKEIKRSADLIIGIHMRRGDYNSFLNGKYYYSNIQYKTFINNLILVFNNKKIAFLLLSNEEIDKLIFNEYNCYFSSCTGMAEDLYLLSQADYILGPPSTFSAWASLYNSSPLYFIQDPELDISKKEFKDIKALWF